MTRCGAMAVAAAFLAGCAAGPELPEVRLAGRALVAEEVGLDRPVSPEGDGFGFARAMDLRFDGDRLVVLEGQNSRLVVFDRELHPIRRIGREGSGPGELRGAATLAVFDSLYAVSEINNGRITIFNRDGQYFNSVTVPEGFDEFAFGRDGTLFVNANDSKHYLLAVDTNGLKRPFGERVWDLYPTSELTRSRPRAAGSELVAVAADGTVHVYDQLLGAMVRFNPAGARTGVAQLPAKLRSGLRKARASLLMDFGGSERDALPTASDLTSTDDGRLLLLFPSVDGVFGLLIEPDSYLATPIRWAESALRARPGLGGMTGVLRWGRFFQLHRDEVVAYRLLPG